MATRRRFTRHRLLLLTACSLLSSVAAPAWGQATSGRGADGSHPQLLPYTSGQKWREYDIRSYTSRVADSDRPEQAVVDWVLRETGTEIWFGEPLGLMSASRDTLCVYHVPEVQERVAAVVARFIHSGAEQYVVELRLVTLSSPNWRAQALPLMRSVPVQTPGVDAWLVSKENAAALLAQLRKRTDYQAQSSPNVVIFNGQSHTLERRAARSYVRSVHLRENWPGYELDPGSINEGYSLMLSPLLSADQEHVDAVIKCHVDQVERFVPVQIDVPQGVHQSQRVQIEVPQVVSWRLHERFRWPTDQVLMLSCGVVAVPGSERTGPFGLPLGLNMGPARADALLLIDFKGKASQALVAPVESRTAGADVSRGRY
jgi:hypothetical protein